MIKRLVFKNVNFIQLTIKDNLNFVTHNESAKNLEKQQNRVEKMKNDIFL